MRVCVVTVFNEFPNYGSFLQAYALQEYLRAQGIEVEFADEFPSLRIKRRIRTIVTRNYRRLRFNIARDFAFARSNRRINSTHRFRKRRYDAVIVGSDEIWNLKNTTFAHTPYLFGAGIDAGRRIAYAPSTNGMTFSDFADREAEKSWLRAIEYLSARDACTLDLIRGCTSRTAIEAVDPTLLIDWQPREKAAAESQHILIYCYGLDARRLRQVEALAKKTAKRILIVGQYHETDHPLLMVDPFEFLGYLRSSAFVVTDSYHGTILAMRYQKPFCSFARDRYKVRSLLQAYGLDSRDGTAEDDLFTIFDTPIDYPRVNRRLERTIAASKRFLSDALDLSR